METISFIDIFKIIKKRFILITLFMVVVGSIATVLSLYVITPVYEAKAQMLVNQKLGIQETYSWSQMETDLMLINTYNVIIESPFILNKVIEELQMDISSDELMDKILITNESDSKVVNIKVEAHKHDQAVEIANAVAEVFKKEIPKLMSVDNINILSEAKISKNPSPIKPNKMLNIAIAAIVGLMIGIGIAFLIEILDTTIKNEKDIEEVLELPIMGLVGSFSFNNENKSSFKFQRKRSK